MARAMPLDDPDDEVGAVRAIESELRANKLEAWGVIRKATSITVELWKWLRAGMPVRSDRDRLRIVAACESCPLAVMTRAGLACGQCGCSISPNDANRWAAKVWMGTTKCPDDPPRW